jgi:putative aminopeptidase FrvX
VAIPDFLRTLLETPGPTGSEAAAAAVWREAAGAFAEVSGDAVGNSMARVRGTGGGPLLALFGHVDEIGVTVTHADDQGNLAFRGLGGWNPQVLLGQRVEILTRNGRVPGVISAKREPRRKQEEKKRVEIEDLHIDVGARDAEDAWSAVRPGDPAVLSAGRPVELRNGRIASRALDNRLGAYIVLEAARRVAEAGGSPGDVVAVATVSEEAGDFMGARAASFALEPAVAIAVDVTWASDVPGGDPKEYGEQKLGDGAAIARGPGISQRLFDLLVETAEAEGIAHCIEVSTGRSHTDADAVTVSRAGVPTGVVSIPLRHMHTPGEICELADVEACVQVLVALARRLGPDTDLAG